MKKKNKNITLKEYRKKFKPLNDEITLKINEVIDEVLPKHINFCTDCAGYEEDKEDYVLAQNVISKALCSISARFLITSRTFLSSPIAFSDSVELKKNFETCLQHEINHYNDWYREDMKNKTETVH